MNESKMVQIRYPILRQARENWRKLTGNPPYPGSDFYNWLGLKEGDQYAPINCNEVGLHNEDDYYYELPERIAERLIMMASPHAATLYKATQLLEAENASTA